MKVLVLNEHEVEELLTMEECIAVMEDALAALARGEVHNPLRQAIRAPGAPGLLGLMPAWRAGATPYYALKEVCVFPENPKRGLDTHVGAVVLHSGETGEPLAFMNASAITAIRTAAVSAVATKLLARQDASVMVVFGAGVQAQSHTRAIPLVRPIRDIFLITRENLGQAEELVGRADILVTATSAREPILRREWIRPGTHINAVGSSIASTRELDSATVAAASLFVDRRESTLNESGDFLFAKRDGVVDDGHIRAELGEVLTGQAPGRTSEDELTLFKSLGLAIEDLASAAFLYEKAQREGRGTWIDF
ncbi:MAG TPA: ornithine cyclodeaminase family protein [Thermoanaerobaculia bacterium]|nr:ornithine cyclodeaminase family protein [Thermoanaerobaculia bacterium]